LLFDKGMQSFEVVTGVEPGKKNSLIAGKFTAKIETDCIPLAYSASSVLEASVVFVGFGFDINNKNLVWNDYANLDVKGKWVMIMRGSPAINAKRAFFEEFEQDRKKVIMAQDKGAAGVILVNSTSGNLKNELTKLSTGRGEATMQIPVIQLTHDFANKLITTPPYLLETAEKNIAEQDKPGSFEISTKLKCETDVVFIKAKTWNVVGSITGKNPNAPYIVIGAHYDHLGMGGPGSGSRRPEENAVHNGADDNASGTATIMELAQKLAAEKANLESNYLIVAFGAEEMGLLGSRHIAKNLPPQVTKVKAMINFDMVGRLDTATNKLGIGGTGTAAEFDALLKKIGEKTMLKLELSTTGTGPSDHSSFYRENIPVLYFNTGVHDDYHTPNDDIQFLNYNGMETIGNLVYTIIKELDAASLTFKEAGNPQNSGSRTELKVKLGIMPAFGDTSSNGLKVEGVTPGGPANKAGLLKGDIIVKINDMQVTNVYDYMARLGKLVPGEKAVIEVIRGTEKMTFDVQL